jgi:hypothetical protein
MIIFTVACCFEYDVEAYSAEKDGLLPVFCMRTLSYFFGYVDIRGTALSVQFSIQESLP